MSSNTALNFMRYATGGDSNSRLIKDSKSVNVRLPTPTQTLRPPPKNKKSAADTTNTGMHDTNT